MNTNEHKLKNGGITEGELAALNERFEKVHPSEIVKWAAGKFTNGLVMTSSFGADSMCTIHLATQVMPEIRIIVINTGFLFPETLAFMEEMRALYRLNVEEFKTRNDTLVWLSVNGEPDPRVRQNVDACCAANKIEVADRAFRETAPMAYLRGVRANQTAQRAQMKFVEWDDRHKSWAISPILRWTSKDVFYYMKEHALPHNPLWERGYLSIGCSPETCTRPVGAGEDERSGRWAGSDKKECGIHLDLGKDI